MPGYPYGRQKGSSEVEISSNKETQLETILPRVRMEILFTVNPKKIKRAAMTTAYHHMPLLPSQVRFYQDRGYKIIVIDTPELFQIKAEKNL